MKPIDTFALDMVAHSAEYFRSSDNPTVQRGGEALQLVLLGIRTEIENEEKRTS